MAIVKKMLNNHDSLIMTVLEQTMYTLIRLLLEEQSDQGLHCLLLRSILIKVCPEC